MINYLNQVKSFITLTILVVLVFFIHEFICEFYDIDSPLKSIYVFNYLAVIFFLVISKLNLRYKLVNILTFFILLTFIKMLSTIFFFLYFKSYGNYDIVIVVYNFFPVYFLLLIFEILDLKKSLYNI
jgi:hypothetical protein